MFLIGLLFSARHFNTNLMWSAFSFINRLRTTSAGLSSPEMRTELLKSVSYLGMTLPEHAIAKTDSHEKEPKKATEKKKQKGRSM